MQEKCIKETRLHTSKISAQRAVFWFCVLLAVLPLRFHRSRSRVPLPVTPVWGLSFCASISRHRYGEEHDTPGALATLSWKGLKRLVSRNAEVLDRVYVTLEAYYHPRCGSEDHGLVMLDPAKHLSRL